MCALFQGSCVGTVDPPIMPLSGLAKKRQFSETAVKGVIYNQEITYSGLVLGGGGRSTDRRYRGVRLFR